MSVHATDPVVRRYLLRNPTAPEIIPQLREFAEHGIEFHTQIVMSPGVNDGQVLRQTLTDLYDFGPPILGCSVVPGGSHRVLEASSCAGAYRRGVPRAIVLIEERAAIAQGAAWYSLGVRRRRAVRPRGCRVAASEIYDGFDQVENGVGSVRWLQQRIRTSEVICPVGTGKRIGVVTGTAMARLMPMVLAPAWLKRPAPSSS